MKVAIKEGFPELEVTIKCPEATEDIRRIEALLYGYGQRLRCVKDGAIYLIEKHDVLYFESVDKRSYLYTAEAIYETGFKLYEIEEMLSGMGFVRTAKAQILNLAKIESLCPDFGGRIEAVLSNGEKVIVSRQYAKTLKERLGLK